MYFWWYFTTITKESESGHIFSTLISSVCQLESSLKNHQNYFAFGMTKRRNSFFQKDTKNQKLGINTIKEKCFKK